jgi:hypothetical protein
MDLSRGLGDVYKRQAPDRALTINSFIKSFTRYRLFISFN